MWYVVQCGLTKQWGGKEHVREEWEERRLERNAFHAWPFFFLSVQGFWKTLETFPKSVAMVEFISLFAVYGVICHAGVGRMKQLLWVQDDWWEPWAVSEKSLIGLESPAMVPSGLRA